VLPDIHHVTQIKILGLTLTNHLSMSEHVRDVTMYVLKILCSHGLYEDELKDIPGGA